MKNGMVAIALCASGLLLPKSSMASIIIANASFESPAVGDGNFTTDAIPGWTGSISATADFGVEDSTNAQYAGTTGNNPLPAPATGLQFAYINGNGDGSASITQTVGTVGADIVYNLRVAIGNRADVTGLVPYKIELLAGTTDIAVDTSSASPASGSFADAIATSIPLAANDPLVGQQLIIRLSRSSDTGRQVDFDNVRLDAIPEPASLSILAIGGLAIFTRRHRTVWRF